jgi:two-component sensor histidine kinase
MQGRPHRSIMGGSRAGMNLNFKPRARLAGMWGAASAGSSDGKAARPKPIAAYLMLMVAVLIIPMIVFSVLLLQRNNAAQQKVLSTLTAAAAASMSEAVDREITGMMTTLRVLSKTPSLFDDDLSSFYDRATRALAGTGAHLVLLDQNYNQLMNTRVPLGTPLSQTSDPDTIAVAIEKRSPVVSDVFFGKVAKDWVFVVALPVFPDNGPPRVVVMTREAASLNAALVRRKLADGWNAALVDGKNTVLTSTSPAAKTGQHFFLDLISKGPAASGEMPVTHEGVSYQAVVQGSELSGWNIVMWAPMSAINRPLRNSLQSLILGGIVMVGLGIGAALLLTRQITGPVRRLARDARRLGTGEMVKAVDYPIAEIATVSHALAKAAERRQASDNEVRFLMREVAHRAKNQLTVVSSIAKQSARSARGIDAFQDSFQKRLHGLARSTDLLIAGGVAGVEFRELLLAQIEPFQAGEPGRVEIDGPQFRLDNQAAQMLGMAIHELATNASKYGAFSVPEGRLSATWRVAGATLDFDWRERVRRFRRRPERRGFGTEVIERMLKGALSAEVTRTQHRDGLEWRFEIPLERLRPNAAKEEEADL